MKGWISIHRAIQDHWIWADQRYLKWWLTLLLNVNHEGKMFPVGMKKYECNPGQSFRSIEQWSDMFSCSKKTTLKFFNMLEDDGMISCQILGKGNRRKHMLTVENWDKYQNKETENYTERVPDNTPKEYPNIPPNNNDNNENNDNNKRAETVKRFQPPTQEELNSYILEKGYAIDAEAFIAFYTSKNWMIGTNKMKDWRAAVITWKKRSENTSNSNRKTSSSINSVNQKWR